MRYPGLPRIRNGTLAIRIAKSIQDLTPEGFQRRDALGKSSPPQDVSGLCRAARAVVEKDVGEIIVFLILAAIPQSGRFRKEIAAEPGQHPRGRKR